MPEKDILPEKKEDDRDTKEIGSLNFGANLCYGYNWCIALWRRWITVNTGN